MLALRHAADISNSTQRFGEAPFRNYLQVGKTVGWFLCFELKLRCAALNLGHSRVKLTLKDKFFSTLNIVRLLADSKAIPKDKGFSPGSL